MKNTKIITPLSSLWVLLPGIKRMACLLTLALAFWSLSYTVSHAATDRYRVMWRDDPTTTMVIGWDQQSGDSDGVYYSATDHGTTVNSYENTKGVDRSVTEMGMNNKFARLTGLTPDTNYYFVIKDSLGGVSPRMWFKTAPAVRQPFSYIAGGDSRNQGNTKSLTRKLANQMVSKLRPLFVAFGGDYTDDSDEPAEWQEWLDEWQDTISDDGRIYPIIPTRGNHDDKNIMQNIFDTNDTNHYHSIQFADDLLKLYVLNTETTIAGPQTDWLAGELAVSKAVTFNTAIYHKPMRSHNKNKAEGGATYTEWAPLFYDYNMDLVVESDSHVVKRTHAIKPDLSQLSTDNEGFVQDDASGTFYIGEGCWGAPLRDADDEKPWSAAWGSFAQLNWIHVHDDKMEVRTIKVDNVASVGAVSDNTPFVAPANLDIWSPIIQEVSVPVLTITERVFGNPIIHQTVEIRQGANGYMGASDTYIEEIDPNDTNKNKSRIKVDGKEQDIPNSETIGLLKFADIGAKIDSLLPVNAKIDLILLKVNTTNAGDSVEFWPMPSNWNEADDWNDLNGLIYGSINTNDSPDVVTGGTQKGVSLFDVTGRVLSWRTNPTSNHGWAIIPTDTNGWEFDSSSDGKELPGGTFAPLVPLANRPTLVVHYSAAVEIRQGANGYGFVRDTYIREDQPTQGNGNDSDVEVDGMEQSIPNSKRIGLLKFRNIGDEVNRLVPQMSSIADITLKVNTTNASGPVEFRPMLSFWGQNSTWNSLTNTKTIPIETQYGSPDVVTGSNQIGVSSFDVTERVLSWIDSLTTNEGWALVPTGTNGWIFDSSADAVASANRPTLVVSYVNSNAQDVGSPDMSGTFSDNGDGTLTMEGGGSIWDTSDNFFFASEVYAGDGELVVRVDSLENTAHWAKAGVMFRETTNANSKNVLLFMRPDKKVTMQSRSVAGDVSNVLLSNYATVGDTTNAKWLKLVRDGDLFTGYYSVDGEGWTKIAQQNIPMARTVKAGLAVTSSDSSKLATVEFSSYSRRYVLSGYVVQVGNVGTPALPGEFLHEDNKYVLDGGGNDIWSTSDNFFFASQMRNGDATVIARVDTLQNTNYWAKAGVMFRESTDANSKNVLVFMRPDKKVTMQSRSATGGGSSNHTTNSAVGDTTNAKWVRLVRSGNVFTGSYSTDGSNWATISSQTISMSASVEVGLAVTSHNNSVTTTAEISNVTIE